MTADDQQGARASDDGREETESERYDRNSLELLQELRVAAVGVQVLFAFLLVVPFQTGWKRIGRFERYDYFVTLLCIAISAVLMIATPIHHRILFRRHEKRYLVESGNRLLIGAMAFLAVGFVGILVLLSDVVFSGVAAAAVGGAAAVTIAWLWFGVPLVRRARLRRTERG